ncbi:MAG: hypothetical protein A3H98_09085 [Bacteroidetes bacterium RIFCSPLOWO2_02_FULL_36_8]|nr:MAG: hypothetical protein A3H98_09085 [Bacteroidetes bacterium RIFCSPLOWO2_02_FULL_36_8]OFY71528.1 MAG: hypothetical protein A3G23_04580 [Bacteroidetes bacterium RIFCSPLOWO2_12_FULL_37_12]
MKIIKKSKIIITGVGGQGIVFLTEIIVEAAMRARINVATSEIHGLSQRGGTVTAGITLGEGTYGMVEEGGADFLLGLEMLEAQRCVNYLNKKSVAVIDNTCIFPYSVNAGSVPYPDTKLFLSYLKKNISDVLFIDDVFNETEPVMRNLVVLSKAVSHSKFPIKKSFFIEAIANNSRGDKNKMLKIFQ